jgi:hypothetical protein
VSPNKYSLKIAIIKKWPENQSDSEEDEYGSLTFVYCKETNIMVPLLRVGLQTPPRMQGSWNNDNVGTPKVVVESSKEMDDELGPIVESSPQYYHRQGH